MADSKVTDLADGGAVAAGDEFYIARAGGDNKIAGNQLTRADGWIDDTTNTWTYVSATSFKCLGVDRTAIFTTGTRIRYKQGGAYKYAVVVSSSFATDTTVTVTGGSDYSLANAAITDNYYSYVANPQGYPGWFTYDCAPTGFSGTPTQRSARFAVVGRICTLYLDITGTSNATTLGASLPIATNRANAPQVPIGVEDSGANPTTPGVAFAGAVGTTAIVFSKNYGFASASWTASGTKAATMSAVYEI